ncbi:flagellin lysine-N-methylase [Psychrobacillus sp.]|uniref:flagellin lysine-N-methylase n=1 Tax=Psychrobacillus sp. TaxID=1871623 RepID=UPI0028BD7464|nr:flagellin lysine-N-methylase [Psychrobacillus sp.]
MTEKTRPVLVPAYLKEFQCIGSACEDTCCAGGWAVTIDKGTFQKYRETRHPDMKELLKKNIARNRSSTSVYDYAKIKMDDEGACTLLDERGLCKVHSLLGPEMLSNTCAIYPRLLNNVDETIEKSLTLSCPEAARLALLNPNGIDFLGEEEPANTKGFINNRLQTVQKSPHFWDLRVFTIQVLQNRRHSIEIRLIILGLFFQKIESLNEQELAHQLPIIIEDYSSRLDNEQFIQSIKDIPTNLSLQVGMGRSLIKYRLIGGFSSKRYLDCLHDVIKGLSLEDETPIEKIIENYKHANETYYSPFMQEHEYILENYMVNFVFKSLFPSDQSTMFESYTMLVINVILVKLHLIGMSAVHKGLSTDLVIKLIQSYTKVFEHNAEYIANVRDSLKESGYSTMAHMAVLIKS